VEKNFYSRGFQVDEFAPFLLCPTKGIGLPHL